MCLSSGSLLSSATLHSEHEELSGLTTSHASLSSASGWGLSEEDHTYYIDFGQLSRVESVTIRGRGDAREWVRQVRISYVSELDGISGDFWARLDAANTVDLGCACCS